MKYFCEEPIRNVYLAECPDENGTFPNWWLQEEYEFALHVTNGIWYLLETKHYYISLGFDGVIKHKKPYTAPCKAYKLDKHKDVPFEVAVLLKQRIREVRNCGQCEEIVFDSFELKLYKYATNDTLWFNYRGFACGDSELGAGKHLLKDCKCGGKPELFFDSVNDYFIRCGKCHKSTLADRRFKKVVDCWNRRKTPATVDTGRESFLNICRTEKLTRIVAETASIEQDGQKDCYLAIAIFEFEHSNVMVTCKTCCDGLSEFSFLKVSNYTPNVFNTEIVPFRQDILFEGIYKELEWEEIVLTCADTKIIFSTTPNDISVSFLDDNETI